MSDDRTVHAETAHAYVVRYERAGKWVIEGKRENFRTPMKLADAAEYCEYQEQAAVTVHWGRPGGRQFDKRLRESNSPAIANPWSAS